MADEKRQETGRQFRYDIPGGAGEFEQIGRRRQAKSGRGPSIRVILREDAKTSDLESCRPSHSSSQACPEHLVKRSDRGEWLEMPAHPFENRHATPRSERDACFAALGLPTFASAEEVTRAYRKLAVTRHPDYGGDADAFRELQHAYRECLRKTRMRPRITGQVARDSFRPAVPQMPRRSTVVCVALTLVAVYALGAWFDTRLATLGVVILGPLALGIFVSQLKPGWSLAVSAVALLAIGIAWAGAAHQIGWISYAFASVPASLTEYEAAVPADKRWGLIAAIAATVVSVLMVLMGCTAALLRERR